MNRDIMREDSLFIEGIRAIYPRIQKDIAEDKDLEKNLSSIENCLAEIDRFISKSRELGKPIETLEKVYGELDAIKEQILKKLYPHGPQ